LYEYAYKLGVSYKVCIKKLYNALGSDSVCQRLKYYSHSIVYTNETQSHGGFLVYPKT